MLYSLSTGVALFIALAMLRVIKGISLWYILVPGYILVFILMHHVDQTFAIAFDSGGAATGPMTVTFILALTIGAAKVRRKPDVRWVWDGSNGCFGIGTFSIDTGVSLCQKGEG